MSRQKIKIKNSKPQVAADDPLEELKRSPAGRAYLKKATAALMAQSEASNVVLPGPLSEAFADGSRQVGGHKLLPVTLGLVAILDQIKSPLLDVVRILRQEMSSTIEGETDNPKAAAAAHAAKMKHAHARMKAEIPADDSASVETVYCFLTPPSELRKELAIGRDHFREHAMAVLGDIIHPVILSNLQKAVAGHYAASFSTVIQHGKAASQEGEVFIKPPAAKTTG